MMDGPTRWLVRPRPDPGAKLRLFCFPYAGGGAAVFHRWPSRLTAGVEVCAVQLPGRGARYREPAFTSMADLVEAAAKALLPYLGRAFALFGHSMGALVGFELARRLRKDHHLRPVHLFVSGREAPQTPFHNRPLHALPDEEFVAELAALNGTPKEILGNREMLEFVMPALRADFRLSETYLYQAEPPLECPISAFGGIADPRVRPPYLDAWREQTTAAFRRTMMPGDHFFLSSAEPQLLAALSRELDAD